MLTDIRRTNGLQSNFLRIGQTLKIPVRTIRPGAQVADPVAQGAEVRGIYLTGPACASSSVFERVDAFIQAGGNAVVFDAKDIDGAVTYQSRRPLASPGHGRVGAHDPVAGRHDGALPPPRAVRGGAGGPLPGRRAGARTTPSWPSTTRRAASGASGTAPGWIPRGPRCGATCWAWRASWPGPGPTRSSSTTFASPPTAGAATGRATWRGPPRRRRAVIAGFLAAARDTLAPLGAKLSTDLFGIMAWDRMEDLAMTGQHVPTIAALVDVICPMIYPSHFRPGFEGRRRPGDDPAYFVDEGTRRFVDQAGGQAEIRPWLQAFPYMVSDYDGDYIAAQVTAANGAGGAGWCLWNPSCSYTVALDVLPGLTRPERRDRHGGGRRRAAGAPRRRRAPPAPPAVSAAAGVATDLMTGALLQRAAPSAATGPDPGAEPGRFRRAGPRRFPQNPVASRRGGA